MKVTKKQIKEAFILWNIDFKLNEDKFISDEDIKNKSIKSVSKLQAKDFVKYLKKVKE